MLKQVQMEHIIWQLKNFGKLPPDNALFGLVEEIGELSHHLLKKKEKVRGTDEEHDIGMKDAIGDIMIFAVSFCSAMGWDVDDVLMETWRNVKKRDWKKYPEKGMP